MIDMIRLDDSKEVITLFYEKYLLSRRIKHWDEKITRLNLRCDFCWQGHQNNYYESSHRKKEEKHVSTTV